MLAPTHSVFGIFLTLIILAVFGIQWSLHWTILLVAILGAIMPDIDHPKSVIGNLSFAAKDQIASLALTENFNLQKRKEQANLAQLEAQADKIRSQISAIESGGGLTPLGRKMLLSKEDIEKQRVQLAPTMSRCSIRNRDPDSAKPTSGKMSGLAELKGQLDEINVKIDELRLKIKSRKFVFSGEVYLRQ